jgi:hypothetical protein
MLGHPTLGHGQALDVLCSRLRTPSDRIEDFLSTLPFSGLRSKSNYLLQGTIKIMGLSSSRNEPTLKALECSSSGKDRSLAFICGCSDCGVGRGNTTTRISNGTQPGFQLRDASLFSDDYQSSDDVLGSSQSLCSVAVHGTMCGGIL